MSKLILFLYLVSMSVDSYYCWINDINTKMLARSMYNKNGINSIMEDEVDGDSKGINLIFPGTKWCGAGNVADNYDDLGVEKEADMCCREHDNCPDDIPGGGTKYNLTNEAFYTRLSCTCDDKFYDCMKAADTKVATIIGVIYFNALQTECFREDYPVTGCKEKGGFLKSKCLEYSYNTSFEKVYQWFDVKEF